MSSTVTGTVVGSISDSQVLDSGVFEPTTIAHRRSHTRFLERRPSVDTAPPKVGQAATQLCRLAFELANETNIVSAANLALDGLIVHELGGGETIRLTGAESKLAMIRIEPHDHFEVLRNKLGWG